MKNILLWTLLIAALVPLTACHRHHRHHHRFAAGYSDLNHEISFAEQRGTAVNGG